MKAKLILGPLSGYVDIPKGKMEFVIGLAPNLNAAMNADAALEYTVVRTLVFRFKKYDDDRCAIFHCAEVR